MFSSDSSQHQSQVFFTGIVSPSLKSVEVTVNVATEIVPEELLDDDPYEEDEDPAELDSAEDSLEELLPPPQEAARTKININSNFFILFFPIPVRGYYNYNHIDAKCYFFKNTYICHSYNHSSHNSHIFVYYFS